MLYLKLLVTSLTLSMFDTSSSVAKMHAASWHSDVHMHQCHYHRLTYATGLSVLLNALATRLQHHSTITSILTEPETEWAWCKGCWAPHTKTCSEYSCYTYCEAGWYIL